ncbi:MAG: hypothetical protein ACR2G4_17500 [Pyrinomonadaceae bacterium]
MLFASLTTPAQTISARLSVVSRTPARLRVECERADGSKAWSFRRTYAGIMGLGERIENLSFSDAQGGEIDVRKLAPGEYEAAREATKVRYEVKLDFPLDANEAAHVSWLTEEGGMLMLGDLLPLPLARVRLNLILPDRWKAATLESRNADGQYESENAESAIFFIAPDLRVTPHNIRGMKFKFATTGGWAFADQDVVGMCEDILKEHMRVIGGIPRKSALVLLAPLPKLLDGGRWSAETRGGTVVFLSGHSATKAAGLARLSVPLAHELLHLWSPNGLALSGEYDWFYEGFTVYQSMRISVRLGHLTFLEYLDSLSRAYDNYLSLRERDNLSLIDFSMRRWSGSGALIYNKGMLVAALYDLKVRERSHGQRSLDDVYRTLFRQHKTGASVKEGNAAVTAALDHVAGDRDFSKHFVESVNRIELRPLLERYGLKVGQRVTKTQIVAADSLSRAQRDLLRQMGYN